MPLRTYTQSYRSTRPGAGGSGSRALADQLGEGLVQAHHRVAAGRRAGGRPPARPPCGRRTPPTAFGGMHHILLRCGLSSFFERLAHRLVRERVHVLQLDHPLGQQAQRPARLALGRPGAGQGDQVGLLLAVQLARVDPRGGLGQQRRLQPLLDEPLPHPLDRCGRSPPAPRRSPRRSSPGRPRPRRPGAGPARGPACGRRPCRARSCARARPAPPPSASPGTSSPSPRPAAAPPFRHSRGDSPPNQG